MSDYIIKIEPGHRPRLEECQRLTTEYMKRTVEGSFEVTGLCRDLNYKYPDLRMVINEERELFNLPGNLIATVLRFVLRDLISGTALLVIKDEDDLRTLTEEEAVDVRETIENVFGIEFEEGEK